MLHNSVLLAVGNLLVLVWTVAFKIHFVLEDVDFERDWMDPDYTKYYICFCVKLCCVCMGE